MLHNLLFLEEKRTEIGTYQKKFDFEFILYVTLFFVE